MRVIVGDLWLDRPNAYRVVPINWTYSKTSGLAVMGRGVAQQCATLYPEVPKQLGEAIKQTPRSPRLMGIYRLFLLPVKFHWRDDASINMMKESLVELRNAVGESDAEIYLPLLGAGFGGLDPLVSMTLMATILDDDRFTLVLKDASVEDKYAYTFRPSQSANKVDRTTYNRRS